MRRDYAGQPDLVAIERFAQRIWSLGSRFHLGDVAWNLGQRPGGALGWRIALWRDRDDVVAFGWLTGPDQLSLMVDPARPELVDDVLAWATSTSANSPTVTILDAETHLVDALQRHGYTADLDGAFFLALSRDLGDHGAGTSLAPPELPPGFVVRPVRGEPDLARRVAVHQEVWNPSGFTEERFRALAAGWPYRPEFDVVVEAPDGRFVAYCLGWYDERNQVGELEPVGTVAEYRRLGLSRAACLAVLRAFRQAGGRTALVYPRGDDDYPVPRQVYAALGFTPHARTVRYRR